MTKVLNTSFHCNAEDTYKYIITELNLSLERGVITQRDRELLERYQMKLEKTCCPSRVEISLMVLVTARRFFKTEFQEVDDDEYEAAFSRIHRGVMLNTVGKKVVKPYSRNYIVSMYSTLKRFFRWMADKNLTKVSEKVIEDTVTGKYDLHTKTENDVLTAEEVDAIINAAATPMYKALFSMLYETGARSIEMANLKWGDLTFQDWGIQVRITDTKTDNMRSVPCITYAKYLYEWANHYNDGEPTGDKFVFISTHKRPIQYQTVKVALYSLVEKTGIQKKVTLHRFRHSRITHMLREGMSETVAKKAFWGNLDSHMIATYGHLTNKDVENEYLRIAGVEVTDCKQDEAPKPITCPTCFKVYPPGTRFCADCGTPLTKEAKKKSESNRERLDEETEKFSSADFARYKELAAELKKVQKDMDELMARQRNEE